MIDLMHSMRPRSLRHFPSCCSRRVGGVLGTHRCSLCIMVGSEDSTHPTIYNLLGNDYLVPCRQSQDRTDDLPHYLLSRISVTGPSLIRETCIMAPNRPVAVGIPCALMALMNSSYRGMAVSGAAASIKLGRRPLLQSP